MIKEMKDLIMNKHDDGAREFGLFVYENRLVVGYCLWSGGGGATSVFSFLTKKSAKSFHRHFYRQNAFAVLNGSQVIFFGPYGEALKYVPDDMVENRVFSVGCLLA